MLRNNQKQAIDAVINNNFNSGIIAHPTGTGKSIIGLNIIKEYINHYPNNNIFWLCEHKFILTELCNNILFNTLLNEFNNTFNIINLSINKIQNWYEKINLSEKPVFIIINRSFLVSKEKYKFIKKNIDFIIHDECHSISNNTTKLFYDYLKDNHTFSAIGLSATPKINIYPFINIIHQYSLYEAFLDKNIVYPKIIWFNKDEALSYEEIALEIKDIIVNLTYKKIIVWCGLINNCYELFNIWKNIFTDFTICIDTSIENNEINNFNIFKNLENNGFLFCAAKHREGSDIKNLDGCIFLDKVTKRTPKTFVQCLGRVLRLQENKNYGLIVDIKAKSAYDIIKRIAPYLNNNNEFPYSYEYYYNKNQNIKINTLIINSNRYNSCLLNDSISNDTFITEQFIKSKFIKITPDSNIYNERIKKEFLLFIEKNLLKYIYFAVEILELTKDIPHVTRGSCGSSLICYLLGITNVDPVKYNIKFERFLNQYRNNLPDIDFDFPDILRDEIFYRLEKKWPGKIARISNHVHFHEKSAKRFALKELGYNKFIAKYEIDNIIKKLSKQEKEILTEKIKKLENTFRMYSLHCGGIIFYPEGVPDYLKYIKKSNNVINQITLNKYDIANEKKFKIDILSSKALSQLMYVDKKLAFTDFNNITIDENVMNVFKKGDNIGITLSETPLIRKAMIKLQPETIKDLAVMLAIIRPAAKDEKHCISDESIIFDDDAIDIIHKYTKEDLDKCDYYRRNFIKNNKEIISEMYSKASNKKKLYEKIKNLHGYSFCKSHAFSYAELIYKLAYIKYYSPQQFWISTLKHNNTSYKKWVHLYEAKIENVDFKEIYSNNKSIYSNNRNKNIYTLDHDTHFQKYGIWNIMDGKFYTNCYGYLNNNLYHFRGIIAQTRMLDKIIIVFLGIGKKKYIELIIQNIRFNKSNFSKIGIKGYGKLNNNLYLSIDCIKYTYF